MAADQKAGKSLDDIASDLEKLGIKPRSGGIWFGRGVADVSEDKWQSDVRLGAFEQIAFKAWKALGSGVM